MNTKSYSPHVIPSYFFFFHFASVIAGFNCVSKKNLSFLLKTASRHSIPETKAHIWSAFAALNSQHWHQLRRPIACCTHWFQSNTHSAQNADVHYSTRASSNISVDISTKIFFVHSRMMVVAFRWTSLRKASCGIYRKVGQTNGQRYGPTDIAGYGVACTWLKTLAIKKVADRPSDRHYDQDGPNDRPKTHQPPEFEFRAGDYRLGLSHWLNVNNFMAW